MCVCVSARVHVCSVCVLSVSAFMSVGVLVCVHFGTLLHFLFSPDFSLLPSLVESLSEKETHSESSIANPYVFEHMTEKRPILKQH